jgi:hypothetical protein
MNKLVTQMLSRITIACLRIATSRESYESFDYNRSGMQFFSPQHLQLIAACYPPSSTLTTSGPDYRPNTQELSRLTYYASNHPGKLTKLGSELLKRVKTESRKAQSGNLRMRA